LALTSANTNDIINEIDIDEIYVRNHDVKAPYDNVNIEHEKAELSMSKSR
jgi:hypothetical protein